MYRSPSVVTDAGQSPPISPDAIMPRVRSLSTSLAAAVRAAQREGRLGPEHDVDIVRARDLAAMLTDPATPRSAIAALDRRLNIVLIRLGLVTAATGQTDLEAWLAGLSDDVVEDEAEPEP